MDARWLLVSAGGSRVRTLLVSVASPAIALGLALLVQPQRELGAVSLFLLAVVGASVVGGIWAGVGSSVLGFVALYPRAIPGLIVGIGFLWSFAMIRPLGGLRNTVFALGAAFIMRYIPYGFSLITPVLTRVSPELDNASRVCGEGWTGTVRRVLLPLLRPALLTGWMFLFITFLKEYSSALFLFARGSEVMGTTMLELWRQGDMGPVSALAAVQVGLILVVFAVARYGFGVRFYG